MTIKLYTVEVTTTFVFACEESDLLAVEHKFARDLRSDGLMQDELVGGDVSAKALSFLPAPYDRADYPWGDQCIDDEKTIGELIDSGAAPEHTKLVERFENIKQVLSKSKEDV